MTDAMSSIPASSGWKVIGQTETERPDPNSSNMFVKGFSVMFQTGSGQTGSVFVPESMYSADHVRQLVGLKAAEMDRVAGLSSS